VLRLLHIDGRHHSNDTFRNAKSLCWIMLEYGLGRGFRAFYGLHDVKPWLKYQRPPHTSQTYFKRRITSENWRPPPFSVEGVVIIQRSVTESLGSVSDATERLLRRAVSISEPSITVMDAVSLVLRRVKEISEPPITVTDTPTAGLFKQVSISETAIEVSDAVNYILQRVMGVSEPTISILDQATAEKVGPGPTERSVSEDLGTLTDLVDVLKLWPWSSGVSGQKSEVAIEGSQATATVIEAQSVTEVKRPPT